MDEARVTLARAVEQGRKWGAPSPLAPLILSYDVCETHENIRRNLRQTMESDYRPFNELLCPPHERELSIAGFGPSLRKTWRHMTGDIWACNGAHDWLLDKGVIPTYTMYWDAAEIIGRFVNPHPNTTYLVASRCHRSVFEALQGCNVYVWHAGGDEYLDDILCEYRKAEPILTGGTAAVSRAMMVCTTMGYRKMGLFGADSSYDGEFTHANRSVVEEHQLDVWCDGRMFKSTSWMAGQVEDFKKLAPGMRAQGCQIELYGDGLMQHVAKINGFTVHGGEDDERSS